LHDRQPNSIGDQNPIAQPGTFCQIEFRLIQIKAAWATP
jgi:hypothetical protein